MARIVAAFLFFAFIILGLAPQASAAELQDHLAGSLVGEGDSPGAGPDWLPPFALAAGAATNGRFSRGAGPPKKSGGLREAMAKVDLAYFAIEYLGIEISEHHMEWSRLVNKHKLLDIIAARGHGKSSFFSYAYIIWRMWREDKTRGLLVSDTAAQVAELLRIIKEGVEFTDPDGYVFRLPALIDIEELAYLVPKNYERSWTGEAIHFTNRSRVVGKTFGTRFRGKHVPWILVDDPHGDDVSYSEVAREKDWTFLKATIEPMLLNGGQLIIVGTPLHADDIHGRTKKTPGWHCAEFPAITVDKDGKEHCLWPEFRPPEYLEQRRKSMGELLFNQEYLLRPASSEASLFPKSLFYRHPQTLCTWLKLGPRAFEMQARGWTYVAGVDFALSAEAGADFTVIVVLGIDEYMNRHLVELVRVKGMAYNQQLALINLVLAPYDSMGSLARVYCESNQAQRIFGDELIRTTQLPIFKFHTTGGEKHSLERGVPSLRVLFENGKMRLPQGDAASVEAVGILLGELQSFGYVDGKLQGVGSHDDIVMALWFADLAARGGVGIRVWADAIPDGPAGDPTAPAPPAAKDHTMFEGELGKTLMIQQGYVPATCTLPVEIAGSLIWREINARRNPCWGCNADRLVCRGAPRRNEPVEVDRFLPLVEVGEPPPREPAPQPPSLRVWVDTVAACAGDEWLARLIPPERIERINGWNALASDGDRPPWVAMAMAGGKVDALYDALRALLRIGEEPD